MLEDEKRGNELCCVCTSQQKSGGRLFRDRGISTLGGLLVGVGAAGRGPQLHGNDAKPGNRCQGEKGLPSCIFCSIQNIMLNDETPVNAPFCSVQSVTEGVIWAKAKTRSFLHERCNYSHIN